MKPLFLFMFLCLSVSIVSSQGRYMQPPPEILQLAEAGAPPVFLISPNNVFLASLDRSPYVPFGELAEQELKLAGLRINPLNYNESRSRHYNGLSIQVLKTGVLIAIAGLPKGLNLQEFSFSPNSRMCAFINDTGKGLSLWCVDIETGIANCIANDCVSRVMGAAYYWAENGQVLYYKIHSGKSPVVACTLPQGPAIQDARGEVAAARTYADLLRNRQDEEAFEHYAQSSIRKFDFRTFKSSEVLSSAIYKRFAVSPDGRFLLVERILKPYSYTLTYRSFPSVFEVYTNDGLLVKLLEERPLQDKVPIGFDAVEAGMRSVHWRSDQPSSLVWCKANDGGNPSVVVKNRDCLFQSDYPFVGVDTLFSLKNRLSGISYGAKGLLVVNDSWRKTRKTNTYLYSPQNKLQLLFERSSEDYYSHPGSFVMETNVYGEETLMYGKRGTCIYLAGEGYSSEGNKPFFDELNVGTLKIKRIWQADGRSSYERIVKVLDVEKGNLLTSVESKQKYPNLYLRTAGSSKAPLQLTFRENPFAALEGITKQVVKYKREDGVDLSANLYLPEGYDPRTDGRLPLLMSAYPTEFKDDGMAGQITGSPHAFVGIGWSSPLFWVVRGYAVLENAKFPIVGMGASEPNDSYVEQLVMNAKAAINAVDSLGVVDPKRCAVMGHSYGAFMTANLLAHSNLFAAGIARSGAYNRTLTPFGFQSEERTYWQSKAVYDAMSPFNYAHQIKSPLLLIHGDADNNPGTFTLQSERMFQAIKGNGGVARLVLLPYESHSYVAKENILHMLWEMDEWLNKYLKN
jgi:dipeptidyl aminopeptidase/acylaminoacyl peptidase